MPQTALKGKGWGVLIGDVRDTEPLEGVSEEPGRAKEGDVRASIGLRGTRKGLGRRCVSFYEAHL